MAGEEGEEEGSGVSLSLSLLISSLNLEGGDGGTDSAAAVWSLTP